MVFAILVIVNFVVVVVDAEANRDLSWNDVGVTDAISLDVGYRLIPLVDRQQDGELMRRIKGVRKRLSDELGFLVSPVRIRDDLDLPASGYRLSVMGSPVAMGEVQLDRELAIKPGTSNSASTAWRRGIQPTASKRSG